VNKTELIEITAEDSGLARDDAAKAIDAMLTAVTNTLGRGEDVTIPGFGKFSTVQRAARTGRNPATGAELEIKAATAPKFTAAAGLKSAVNTNGD
jgi:DNA-binding protein HU-beta